MDSEVNAHKTTAQWARVRARLRSEYGETAFRSWLKALTLAEIEGSIVRMTVPEPFMEEWIRSQYAERLKTLWQAENPNITQIDVFSAGARSTDAQSLAQQQPISHLRAESNAMPADIATEPSPQNGESEANLQKDPISQIASDLSASLDTHNVFENFVVGESNELAFAAARQIAEGDHIPFNPLFLFGGVGLGKTHLMHAIAWHLHTHAPQKKVIYLSAEKFMYQFIRALRYKDTMTFKEKFRSVDVLLIDDIQFIAGKETTQEEFFHTFNALVDQNRQVVMSADRPPIEMEGIENRMKSRLGGGLVAEIHATNYELRLGILQNKVKQMCSCVPTEVLEFLAYKIASNVRELEGALNRLVAYSNLVGRSITLESAQEVLHDLLRVSDRQITVEEIQRRVAEHYHVKLNEMSSARRSRAVARPRQVAMYLSKHLTSRSLPEIGRKFGGRDHTTVMHAVKKVTELRQVDAGFCEDVNLLHKMLDS